MIKAVFFDASETLIHLPRGVAHHYRRVAQRHGLDLSERDLAAAFRHAWKTQPRREISDSPRPDDDKGWWRQMVAGVLAQCHAKASDFPAFFEELYAHFAEPGVWEIYPDVLPALDELRGKFSLGIVSNFDRRLYAILRHVGIARYFDAVFLSSEAGADKPHPQIFQRALAHFQLDPPAALHVGDDPERDWRGAEAAGLACFRLDRKANTLLDLPAFIAARNRSGS